MSDQVQSSYANNIYWGTGCCAEVEHTPHDHGFESCLQYFFSLNLPFNLKFCGVASVSDFERISARLLDVRV